MEQKMEKKFFRFSDNYIWIRSSKVSQSRTGYLPSAVNLLTNTTKTSSNTRGDIFQINFPDNDGKTWRRRSHWDLARIWDTFTCWLSKRVLKRRFLDSGLSKIITVPNFGYPLTMRIIIFFKIFKIWCSFQKWQKKIEKMFFVFQIMAFELGVANCGNIEQDTCQRQCMC